MDERQERGIEIAKRLRITVGNHCWYVPSQYGTGSYTVTDGGDDATCACTCDDFETRGKPCKHVYAVREVLRRVGAGEPEQQEPEAGSLARTRKTYRQQWPEYNAAQTTEKHRFQELLAALCATVEEPPRRAGKGRPPVRLSDAIFAATFKVFSTVSARRFTCDLSDARDRGHVSQLLHFNSVLKALDNPSLTPILTNLIVASSRPLATVEVDFAVDSTGFGSSRYARWYDKKYGCVKAETDWVKAHLCCGVKTNVVSAVKIDDGGDAPQLPGLVNTTAAHFTMEECSADKAYLSAENLQTIADAGAKPFIPFKVNSAPGNAKSAGLWEKLYHFFSFQRDEFLQRYHKRSNVESTVSMIKAKFRDEVRGKGDVAMKNEVLCKILCHNICCLISAFHELGIEAAF